MTVTIDRLTVTVSPCPTWCPPGHELSDGDDRLHEKTLVDITAADVDAGHDNPVRMRLFIERYDTLRDAHLVDKPIRTQIVAEIVHVHGGGARVIRGVLTSDQLRALAVAAFHGGFLLDDAADATMTPATA